MRKYLLTFFGAIVFAFIASTSASAQAQNPFDDRFAPEPTAPEKYEQERQLADDIKRDNDERRAEQEKPGVDLGTGSVTDNGPKGATNDTAAPCDNKPGKPKD